MLDTKPEQALLDEPIEQAVKRFLDGSPVDMAVLTPEQEDAAWFGDTDGESDDAA